MSKEEHLNSKNDDDVMDVDNERRRGEEEEEEEGDDNIQRQFIHIHSTDDLSILSIRRERILTSTSVPWIIDLVQKQQQPLNDYQCKTLLSNYHNRRWHILPKVPIISQSTKIDSMHLLLTNVPCKLIKEFGK